MGMMQVRSSEYVADLDLFAQCVRPEGSTGDTSVDLLQQRWFTRKQWGIGVKLVEEGDTKCYL